MIPKMFSHLNKKTWFVTVLSVFAFIWVSDFIIHTKILAGAYEQTASMWRTAEESKTHFIWLLLGQFWMAALFTTIFGMGYEGKGWKEGLRYGLLIGLFFISPNFIHFATMPMPQTLMFSWIFWGLAQCIGAGFVACFVWGKFNTHQFTHSKAA